MNKNDLIPCTMAITSNMALTTDAYKQGHWKQYPKNVTKIQSYFESRGSDDELQMVVFFGLQITIKKYLRGVVITQEMVEEADEFCKKMFGQDYFNRAGWERIVNVHGGKLPIRIKAVPEGSVVPVHNVLMTIESTDDELPFITNFVETLLVQMWYPITVATKSYRIKNLISKYAKWTGCEVSPFSLNDFGERGASSMETAGIGGCAHLVNFMGTDTIEGIRYAMKYYDTDVCGYSVMAAEHSTITIYGRENEAEAVEAVIDAAPESATVAIVSDSYDIYNACRNIFGKRLKAKILARSGKVVIRPDSGFPPEVCVKVLNILWEAFGGTVNAKGYKVLDPHIGVIYGDGIDYPMIDKILLAVKNANYSVENVVFGMGGALLQIVNRDTYKFAFKCCAAVRDGVWILVGKDPATDYGKRSKRGRMVLIQNDDGEYETIVETDERYTAEVENDLLVTVFENGELVRDYTFDEVRQRVESERAKYANTKVRELESVEQ
jgi:nicotinamide phosphoribosyltransferase